MPNYKGAVDKLASFECDGVELLPYVSVAIATTPVWAVEIGGLAYATGIEASQDFENPAQIKAAIAQWFRRARAAGLFRGNPRVNPA